MKTINSWSSPTLAQLMTHPETTHIAKQLVAGEDLEAICRGLTYFEADLEQGGRRLLLDYCHETLGPCLLARYCTHYGLWSWARGYCPFTEDDLTVLKSDPFVKPALVEWIEPILGGAFPSNLIEFEVTGGMVQLLCAQMIDPLYQLTLDDSRLEPLVEAILAGESYQELAPDFDVSEHAQRILKAFCQQKTVLESPGFSPWAGYVGI